MTPLIFIIAFIFVILSIIDYKYREIPAFFLTGLIFLVLALNQSHLFFGILGFVFAYLLYEAQFIGGVADIKLIIVMALLVGSLKWFFILAGSILVLGIATKLIIGFFTKKEIEFAFIPVLLLSYLFMMIIGGFG